MTTVTYLVVVFPARRFGQRHEDRLNAAARLEAKHRAAIVDQVKLHIPGTAFVTATAAAAAASSKVKRKRLNSQTKPSRD